MLVGARAQGKVGWAPLLNADGSIRHTASEEVEDAAVLLSARPASHPAEIPAICGIDFPIGLLIRYAETAGVSDFRSILSALERGDHPKFSIPPKAHLAAQIGTFPACLRRAVCCKRSTRHRIRIRICEYDVIEQRPPAPREWLHDVRTPPYEPPRCIYLLIGPKGDPL